MESIMAFFAPFMEFMAPYWTTLAVFILFYGAISHFEELLGIRGIVIIILALVIAILFYFFWDDIALKFANWLKFLGLESYEKGSYGTGGK